MGHTVRQTECLFLVQEKNVFIGGRLFILTATYHKVIMLARLVLVVVIPTTGSYRQDVGRQLGRVFNCIVSSITTVIYCVLCLLKNCCIVFVSS